MHLNKCIDKINQLITPSTSNTLFCHAFTKMQYKKCMKMNAFIKWNKCIKIICKCVYKQCINK